jgi:acyl carrier protein
MEWFSARGKAAPGSSPSTEINYFEAGWLTSAEVVEFVTEIEEKFGIQFTDADLGDGRFVTIGGLSQLIAQHLPRTADGV